MERELIEAAYPDDHMKQLQVTESLHSRYKAAAAASAESTDVAKSVLGSLRKFYEHLKKKHKGRYSSESRMALQAVSTAIVVSPTVSLERISTAVGVKKCHLTKARKRWTAYVDGYTAALCITYCNNKHLIIIYNCISNRLSLTHASASNEAVARSPKPAPAPRKKHPFCRRTPHFRPP